MIVAAVANAAPVLPTGGQFVAGAGAIGPAGASGLQITQQGARGIIDWKSFSIGAGGKVAIDNGAGATLNRVTGGQASNILGNLSATGSVYLINPQGVVVGPGGKVLAGNSVVLSTRDISNGQFMAGGAMAASGTGAGDITNLGSIVATQGNVALIARSVTNQGQIQAVNGQVNLAAANSVVLSDGASNIYVAADSTASGDITEQGRIQAAAAALTAAGGNVYTLAGNRRDLIEATGTKTVGGQVWLSAPNGEVQAGGDVTARNADGTGGQITVQGGKSTILTGSLTTVGVKGGQVLVGVTAPGTGLSDSTTIADGAVIRTGGPLGGGQVETSGHKLSVGAAQVSTGGGAWLLDPTDVNIDVTAAGTIDTALASGNVTIQTTSGSPSFTGVASTGVQTAGNGDITLSSGLSWSSSHTLTLQAFNAINLNAGVTNSSTGGLTLTAGGSIASNSAGTVNLTGGAFSATAGAAGSIGIGGTVSAKTVSLTAGTGGIALTAGVTGTGTGNSVLFNTTGVFNNTIAGGVQATGSGAFWRIYSVDPLQGAANLTPDFYQYGVGNNGAVDSHASGNGLIYSATQTVSGTLVDNAGNHITRAYDGSNTVNGTSASIAAVNLSLSGLVSSDIATPTTGAGSFSQSDVGDSLTVTLTGGLNFSRGGKPVYGYGTSGAIQGVIGSITPANATLTLTGTLGKIYDSSTLATLTSSNFIVGGLASGESITVGQPVSASYDSANAGSRTLTVVLGPTSYDAGSGTKLTNYTLPVLKTASGVTIAQAPVQVLNLSVGDKTYDSTADATPELDTSHASIYGLVNASDVTLVKTGATATFAQSGAGANIGVTIGGFTLANGSGLASNYQIVEPTNLTANIGKATLTVTGFGALGRGYNGGTLATLTGSALYTALGSDSITLGGTAAGNFASKDAGSNIGVTVTGLSLDAASANNYTLAPISAGTATISRAAVTVGIQNDPTKTYNGVTTAALTNNNYSFAGFAPGEGVTVSSSALANYDSANASTGETRTVSASLNITDFTLTGSTKLSNYTFNGVNPDSHTVSVSAANAGTINTAPLLITIVNDPTKTFDHTNGATLGLSNYEITGLVGSETAQVNQTAGTYGSINAGVWTVTSGSLAGQVAGTGGGFSASNYSIPAVAVGPGTINPAPLTLGGGNPFNLNIGIINNPTKVYDGLTSISLASSNFDLQGLQGGDIITVKPTTGTFGSANAGLEPISVTLLQNATSYTATGGALLGNYILPTLALGEGTVTRAPVTVSITGDPTKTYNGNTVAVLGAGNFNFSGFVGLDGVTVDQVASANYDSKDASTGQTRTVIAQLAASDYTASGTTRLANYTFNGANPENGTFTVSTANAGTINKAPLTILGVGAQDKVYDRTNVATINTGSLYGVVAGEDVQLTQGSTGTFSQSNVGSNLTVTPDVAYSLAGTANLNNYSLTAPVLKASISPKALTITTISADDKDYDGTTTATVNASGVTGVISGDTVSLDSSAYTANFKSSHAADGVKVTASGFGLGGGDAGNYTLTQPAGLVADIDPALITAVITGTPTKTYDGGTAAILLPGNYHLTGFIGADGATVIQQTSANYDSKNATTNGGATVVNATLVIPDFRATGSTDLTNYALPTNATGAGVINPATLIAQIVNNPTKTYDGGTGFSASTDNTGGNAGAGLLTSNYKILGWATGEGSDVTLTKTTATYATQNAGITTLSNSLAGSDYHATTTDLGNYTLATTASGGGTINKRALTVALNAQTKVYDGTTAKTGLTTGSFVLGNFAGSESGLLGNHTSGVYNSIFVDTANSVTVGGLAIGDVAGANGFSASNYTIQSSVTNNASTITPKTITVGSVSRVYDATTTIDNSAHVVSYTVAGLVGSDSVNLDTSGVTGSYTDNKNVGAGNKAFSLSGVLLSSNPHGDYQIASTQTGTTGTITQRPLTVTGAVGIDKVYDGTTAANVDNTNTVLEAQSTGRGYITGDVVNLTMASTGTFSSKDVGHRSITTTGYAISGGDAGNYLLSQPADIAANITQALAQLTLIRVQKVYDSTNTISIGNAQYTLSGIYGGDNVTLATLNGTFDSVHVAGSWNGTTVSSGIGVVIGSASLNATTDAANYTLQLPADHTAIGVITPRALTLAITGTPTKTYDGLSSYNTGSYDASNTALTGLTLGNYVLGGVQTNDTVTLNMAADGSLLTLGGVFKKADGSTTTANVYNATTNPNGAQKILVSGIGAGEYTLGGVAQSGDYTLPTSALGAGAILPRLLAGAIIGTPTKTYDNLTKFDATTTNTAGNAGQGLIAANYLLGIVAGDGNYTGFAGSESATIARSLGVFDTAAAGSTTIRVGTGGTGDAALAASDFHDTGSTGFLASNYALPTTVFGPGSIGQRVLTLNQVTKVYDGSGSVTGLLNSAYTLGNVVSGDDVQVNAANVTWDSGFAGTNPFNTFNVNTAGTIPMYLASVGLTGNTAGNYTIASTTGGAAIGKITARPLFISLADQTKVYDGNTADNGLTTGSYIFSNLVSGETVDINLTSGAYDFKDVDKATKVTATVGSGNFTNAQGGFALSNYSFNTTVTTALGSSHATITPITLGYGLSATKPYDGGNTASLLIGNLALTGFIGSEGASLTGVTGAHYDGQNVVGTSHVLVSLTGSNYLGTGSTDLADYVLPTGALSGSGIITAVNVTGSIIGNPTKVYDGTTSSTLGSGNYQLNGLVNGETATVTRTGGVYDSANVLGSTLSTVRVGTGGTGDAVLTGSDYSGSTHFIATNYVLPTTLSGAATITPLTLLAGFAPQTRAYNNTTAATGLTGFYVTGFLTDLTTQYGLTTSVNSGTYNNKNVTLANLVTSSGTLIGTFATPGGELASNYQLPTHATASGTITPATLAATFANTTKTYDGGATTNTLTGFALTGFFSTDGASLTGPPATTTYGLGANVQSGSALTASLSGSDFSMTSGTKTNYQLPANATGIGAITQRALTISLVDQSKQYDGSTSDSGLTTASFQIANLVSGETVDLNITSAAYDSKDLDLVTKASTSVASGNFTNAQGGFALSNYSFNTTARTATGAGHATITPITLGTTLSATKPYDGGTAASLLIGNLALTGWLNGDNASLTGVTGAHYDGQNVVGTSHVLVSLSGSNYLAGTNGLSQTTDLHDYVLPTGSLSGSGVITAVNVTGGIIGNPTKVYDGTINSTLGSGNYQLVGLVNGETATVTRTSGLYDSANVLGSTLSTVRVGTGGTGDAVLAGSDYSGSTAFIATNYNLPTTLSGAATITPLTLAASLASPTKVYDGAANATGLGGFYVTGFLTDLATHYGVTTSVTTGTYNNANVALASSVTSGSLAGSTFATPGGELASNYQLPSTASALASITPLTLAASFANTTKIYDGGSTTSALTGFALTGFIGSDGASLTSAPSTTTYGLGSNVQTHSALTASLSGADFSMTTGTKTNYQLPSTASGFGDITQRALTVSLVDQTKQYDGNANDADLTTGSFQIANLVSGQTVDLNITSGTYDSKDVDLVTKVSTTVGSGNFTNAAGGFALSNYSFNTTATTTAGASHATITAITLGSTLSATKPYDGGTAASVAVGNLHLTGFIGSEGATLTGVTGAHYDSQNVVGATQVLVSLTGSNYLATGSTDLHDYVLPTGALSGSGIITAVNVTGGIIGNPTKVYDGTAAATLGSGNYQLTGLVNGETATVTRTSGVYGSANVLGNLGSTVSVGTGGTGDAVLTGSDYSGSTHFIATNYNLPTALTGNGTITPLTLAAGLASPTKVYDGNANATGLSGFFVTGFLTDLATHYGVTTTVTTGTYNNANVALASSVTSASLAGSTFAVPSGELASNYQLPTTASALASITPLTLAASFSPTTKVYDGLNGTNTLTGFALTGFIGLDGANLTSAPATTTYGLGANVQTHSALTASLSGSDFAMTTGTKTNYQLPSTASGFGGITQAPLTVSISGPTKVYDGTTTATLATGNYTLTGLVHGETATIGVTSGTYASQNVLGADGSTVNVASIASTDYTAGTGGSGTTFAASNYSLPTSATGTGTITQAPLSLAFTGNPTKVYDGTTSLTGLTSANYIITGLQHGETATVDVTSGTYGGQNVLGTNGSTVNVASIGGADYIAGTGSSTTTFLASNYSLPGSVSGVGTITQAALSVAISGPTKVYDGNTSAALDTTNYAITGLVHGETATVDVTSGTYGSKDVLGANASTVNVATLGSGDYVAGTGGLSTTFLASNYSLPVSASGTGTITPKAISGLLSAQTKVYDATATASGLTSGMYSLTGFIGSESAVLNNHAAGTYNSKNVTAANTVTVNGIATGDYTGSGGYIATNYSLPTTISGAGTITPAPLHVANLGVDDKVYDGTTAATLDLSHVTATSLSGVFSGDDVTLSALPGGATFLTPNVGTAIAISLSGQAITGLDVTNYTLSSNALPTANITPRPLTANIINTPTKTYDGNTGASLTGGNFLLSGFVTGQGSTVTQTVGAYDTANAASRTVTASLPGGDFTANSGTLLSNYILPVTASGPGLINPKVLTASIVNDPTKTYDATTGASLTTGNFLLNGFVGSEGAVVTQTAGTYAVADAGSRNVTASLPGGDFNANGGTLLSNYVLPISAQGPGQINQAPLAVSIIGDPTKFFDGNNSAKLTPTNYQVTGFVGGQGGTITQTAGTYGGITPGDQTVTAALASGDYAANSGTLLSNYFLPLTATGPGHINPALSSDLYTRFEARLLALGLNPNDSEAQIREIQFAMATPRIYIPFPAPGALSTWKGNGFGSLPIVVDQTTEFAEIVTEDGAVATQSGPPVINNTEQVLLQGVRSKQYRIIVPAPATASSGAIAPQAAAAAIGPQASAATIGPLASR